MSSLKLEVFFKEDRQMDAFVKMLRWMEFCGDIGHCTDFLVRMDGDGSARPKFMFENPELQKSYYDLRNDMREIFERGSSGYGDGTDLHVCIS